MLKKSNLLCSCGLQLLYHPRPSPYSSPPHSNPSLRADSDLFQEQWKRLAHGSSFRPFRDDEEFSWPSAPDFTPYDIFQLDSHSPYSKARFYELAKIYHPDRPCNGHPLCRDLSDATRTERYRIIVTAHELLSDPVKRAAYDRYGHGWGSKKPASGSGYARADGGPDPIFRNATWEDWEDWRHAKNEQPATSTPVSHGTFATFIILVALFVGSAHAVAIGKYSSRVEERVKEFNEKCAEFMQDRRHRTMSQLHSGDERIQNFLIKRDPTRSGLKKDEEPSYRRALGKPHTAVPEDSPQPQANPDATPPTRDQRPE